MIFVLRVKIIMHSKNVLETIGILHRAHSETKAPSGDQMSIGGIAVGPSSRFYGVRIKKLCIRLKRANRHYHKIESGNVTKKLQFLHTRWRTIFTFISRLSYRLHIQHTHISSLLSMFYFVHTLRHCKVSINN